MPSVAEAQTASTSSDSPRDLPSQHQKQKQAQTKTDSLFSAGNPFAHADSATQKYSIEGANKASFEDNGCGDRSHSAALPDIISTLSTKDGPGLPVLDIESAAAATEPSSSSLTPNPAVVTHCCRTPSDAGLRLQTDPSALNPYPTRNPLSMTSSTAMEAKASAESASNTSYGASAGGSHYNPVLKSAMSAASFASSMSPRSALSSPSLHALVDLTPLPSPLLTGESPGPWKRSTARPTSSGSACSLHKELFTLSTSTQTRKLSPPPRKRKPKSYGLLTQTPPPDGNTGRFEHGHVRSVSESVPEATRSVRPRHVTISGYQNVPLEPEAITSPHIQREENLAAQRGLTADTVKVGSSKLPSPPSSNRSATESEDGDEEPSEMEQQVGYLAVRYGTPKRRKVWRQIREIGQGTFSKVVLATNQELNNAKSISEDSVDPKSLVAIKIIHHGPAGGADEDRIALSLKREVEIMQSVRHPSVIQLRAFEFDQHRALLVLNYCPGGDLFVLASEHRMLLVPSLVQRIFAELVAAVRHLHAHFIVHRDIKLESRLFKNL